MVLFSGIMIPMYYAEAARIKPIADIFEAARGLEWVNECTDEASNIDLTYLADVTEGAYN